MRPIRKPDKLTEDIEEAKRAMVRYKQDDWTPDDPFKLEEVPRSSYVNLRARNPMWNGRDDNVYVYTPYNAPLWHHTKKYIESHVDYGPTRSFQRRLKKGRRRVAKAYKKGFTVYLTKKAARDHAEKHLGGDDV